MNQRRSETRTRTNLAAVVFALTAALPALGHPGQHMGLKIFITDDAVRYDILMSADLRNMIVPTDASAFYYNGPKKCFLFVDPKIEQKTRDAYQEFFKKKNAVTIDGVRVLPVLEKLKFIPYIVPGMTDSPLNYPPDVEITLAYPTKGRPKQVTMVWELFPQDPTRAAFGLPSSVEVMAEIDAYDQNKVIFFTADEPEYTWHYSNKPARKRVRPVVATFQPRTIPIPLLSLAALVVGGLGLFGLRFAPALRKSRGPAIGLVIAALLAAGFTRGYYVKRVPLPWEQQVEIPDNQRAIELFETLQRNVYRAFDYKSESDIYDVLDQSVDGDLLDQIYNEVYQSLILRDQGGAVARIESVNFLDTAVVSKGVEPGTHIPAFKVRSRWRVRGIVRHWGHAHRRTNEYSAIFTVAQRGNAWKITGVENIEQRRIVKPGDDPSVAPRPSQQGPF